MRVRVLSTLLLVAAVAAPAAPAAATGPPRLTWEPCAEAPQDPALTCATLTVPVDWSRPEGPTIELALARRPATDTAARVGVLLFDTGGPGSSGVDAVLGGGPNFSPQIRSRFDIVGFDHRGIGRSHPVLCSAELLRQTPFPHPRNQAELDHMYVFNQLVRDDCRALTGPLFDHVDSLSVARDMEAIRAALGETRLTFYGISYGSVLAGQYAELFPHRVRAMVLDSVLDHSLGTRGLMEAGAISLQDSFDQFAAWCDAEVTCALHGHGVKDFTAQLLARIERGEVLIPDDPPYPAQPWDFLDVVQQALRFPVWGPLAQFMLDLSAGTPPAASAAQTPVPFAGWAVRCHDFAMPLRDYRELTALLRRSQALAPDTRLSPDRLEQTMRCLGTRTPIANPQHRLKVRTAVPLLVVNNRHDPVTGHAMAANVARQLGRHGRLFTYEGWGHGTYHRSDCVTTVIDRYLLEAEPPADGAACPAVPPPDNFFGATSALLTTDVDLPLRLRGGG